MTKQLHYVSGLIISVFVGFHLLNHAWSVFGADQHIKLMDSFRVVYRNVFAETVLLLAVVVQLVSGFRLFNVSRKAASTCFKKLHVWSGLYLAVFFLVHLSAVLGGRYVLQLDTNFYFGVAGLNTFPLSLFFVPYYGLAMLAFFGHIASVHRTKMKQYVVGLSPISQAKAILAVGCYLTIFIFYGLTNRFRGVRIPAAYHVLIGK